MYFIIWSFSKLFSLPDRERKQREQYSQKKIKTQKGSKTYRKRAKHAEREQTTKKESKTNGKRENK